MNTQNSSIKISVVTPTIRPEGLVPLRESLMKQTFPGKDWEWLIDINVSGKHDLNASFNKMIKRSKGELIVFLEDYTSILPDGLERFWKAYQDNPNTLFTAPLGKVDKFGDKPRWDWRAWKQDETQTDYTACGSKNCELDWGAIPRKVLYDIGGFDEELDNWWSMDNVSVGDRADKLGYKFLCVFSNPAVAIDHDKIIKHPFREHFNPKEANMRMMSYYANPKLDYLN